jgi:hypothetical protein
LLSANDGHDISISEDDQLICLKPDNNQLENVRFFYGCGMPEQQMKKEAGTSRKLPLYQYTEFFEQETMISYGVQF